MKIHRFFLQIKTDHDVVNLEDDENAKRCKEILDCLGVVPFDSLSTPYFGGVWLEARPQDGKPMGATTDWISSVLPAGMVIHPAQIQEIRVVVEA